MKLGKQQEKELLKAYNAYWDCYLKGDVKKIATLLAKEYTQVGSAESEVFFTKKDAVQFLHDTIEQVAGKLEMRNRIIKPEQQDDLILIHEQCDLYVLDGKKWIFYSKFRASSLMQEKKDGWKIIHQHSSFPDTKTGEGQNIAIDKIAEENLQLREAVKRRTIELEQKNRELEIETALEKVRARTMAMQQSDELPDAANLLFQQMQALGMPAWSAGYCIWDDDKQGITLWMSSEGVMQPSFHMPLTVDPSLMHMKEAYERKESFHAEAVGGEELASHYRYMRTLPGIDEVLDSIINAGHPLPAFQIFHCVYFSQGFLLFITYEPVPEAHEIFKRFGNVFDQTYTRFLDLQKAEAQSREAQIELGLERVRARAMAMQKSDELAELVHTVFKELTKLHLSLDRCIIMIYDPQTNGSTWWMSNSEEAALPIGSFVKYHEYPPYLAYINAWKDRTLQWKYLLGGNEKKEWDNFIFSETDLSLWPQPIIDGMKQFEQIFLNASFNNFGSLTLASMEPLPEEHFDILLRFAKVFDLTYTRFNDLQKAEAQTKEARIEAALERVRSRTMAMHKSDELLEVVTVLAEQLVQLNFKFDNVSFGENNQDDDFKFWFIASGQAQPLQIQVPYRDNPAPNRVKEAQQKGLKFFSDILSKEENRQWTQHLIDHSAVKLFPDQVKQYILNSVGYARSTAILKNINLYIGNYKAIPYTAEENNLFQRFAQVFEQSYTRFLDLKKAEAQAREAQIEAALEKVRSRSLAMHQSDELKEVMSVMFQRLSELDVLLGTVAIQVFDPVTKDCTFWIGNDKQDAAMVKLPYDENIISEDNYMRDYWEARNSGESFFNKVYSFEQKNRYFGYVFANNDTDTIPPPVREFILKAPSHVNTLIVEKNSALFADNYDNQFYTAEKIDVLKRTAKVFDQAYVRFLDLQKAESQAREAQIELSLERVRAKTMAMHNSADVADAVASLFDELLTLGIEKQIRCGIGIIEESMQMEVWTAYAGDDEKTGLIVGRVDMTSHQMMRGVFQSWKNKETHSSYTLSGEDEKDYYRAINSDNDYPVKFDINALPQKQYQNAFYFREGFIYVFSPEKQLTAEAVQIFKRFAGAFGLTYRRFLDLQKAEAQAREAQIELSLERVRAKTMAMHNSQDVGDTVAAMFDEVVKLGIETIRCGIGIMHEPGEMEVWTAKPDENGKVDLIIGRLDMMMHPLLQGAFNGWQNKQEMYTYELAGDDLIAYFNAINNHPDYPIKYDMTSLPLKIFHSEFHFPEGTLFVFSLDKLSIETSRIFKRFAGVFGQTYRRYLDLKKAEAQVRHAQVEASMEKVRNRSLAMQKPEELVEVAEVLRKEMGSLGIEELETSSIYIVNEITGKTECWYAIKDIREGDKKLLRDHMIISLANTWVGKEMLQFYHSDKKQTSILMQGENRKEWINYCAAHSNSLQGYYGNEIPERTYHLVKFSNGYMGAASPGNISTESWDLLQRATAVFSFAYTRFLDLQKAEVQAREATIETALERVRSRTLAMQKSDELSETAAVLFRQLITLGIAPNRLYIGIIKDDIGHIEFWVTDEDGSKVSTQFTGDMTRNESMKKMYEAWKVQLKSLTIDMQGEELSNYFHYLADELGVPFKKGLSQKRRIQSIAFFGKGFIGIASPDVQPEETTILLERFAAVFNLTYTRFNDLKIAEAHAVQAQEDLIKLQTEKIRAEDALTELRATQKQLVQSEKMASLGQLTAGIAHEIQNPLNFVNNFSEVSEELIQELKSEKSKVKSERDEQLEEEILNDLIQNLKKINHHGKRADSIVKGMLEHSRTSAGNMEPTDVNALADEYLRLSYHGIRAKDKLFNTAIQTDFDNTIGKINIIGQDIGRALLNLYNNAFYAVKSPNPLKGKHYQPAITVSTKKMGDKIFIRVKDNGAGIPQNIVDKIFQPFFTTKPTGSGTGLGLSLAYDIVKAHGGEIKVDTKESEGSEFIIQLPIV